MKVLWIVNMLLPEAADAIGAKAGFSGTWMINLSKELSESGEVDLAIACVHGDTFREFKVGNITYFCIPGNGKTMMFYHPELVKYWEQIEDKFQPDIVHFHGTEYSHGISYLRRFPDKKKVLTIQGIIDKTSQFHSGELPLKVLLKYRTLNEMLHFNGMIERRIVARRNVDFETELIKNIPYATGRTDWDKFYIQSLNPSVKYYRCYYDLREEFYHADKWDISKVNRNVIYASNSTQMPMKGGHAVIEALRHVKKVIPDVKAVFLAPNQKDGKLIPTTGYTKYICDLIKKYDLEDNVEFVGSQRSEGIINLMTTSHLTVVPSAIENASATLREAMHLGAPCIASFRGGMAELVEDGKSGFFFDYSQYEYLAGRIIQVLQDDNLATNLSKGAVERSANWHNKEVNKQAYLDMYRDVFKS